MTARIDGPWRRTPGVRSLFDALHDAGHAAYFVGGCVRNALLGEPVGDVDVATDARPEAVVAAAEAAGLKCVPTGIDHGTVTVIARGDAVEVTTFRRDVETDGRHAVIAFSDRIDEDAARRDFTMNALYAAPDGTVVDPLGGLPDLRARRVRFVGDARSRITEDYLRILRYFRFHAWYGDPETGIDAEALAACAELADGLPRLSAERVGAEMRKLLAARDPAPAVAAMGQSGVLWRVLPGATADALAPLVHLEGLAGATPDPVRRLAALGAADAPDRLRLTRRETRRLAMLREGISAEAGTAELAHRLGPEAARDIELLRGATYGAPLPADLEARLQKGAAATFPVRAADLKDRFEGAALGAELDRLRARWIASDFALSRAALLGGGAGDGSPP